MERISPTHGADNDSCALRSWHEWAIRNGERRNVLCVETRLELLPGYPNFDAHQLDNLIMDATDMMRTSASPIDAIRIVPSL